MSTRKENREEPIEQVYSKLIDGHRAWLGAFSEGSLRRWQDLLEADPEAAICEAGTRKLLCDHRIEVEANEDISGGGPDFLCIRNNKRFYVEATCIKKDVVTGKTGLSDALPHPSGVQHFGLLTKRLFYEMCNKTRQCSDLDASCVLAIGTLHFQGGVLCFERHAAEQLLTGTTFITAPINTQSGEIMRKPYEATDLADSGFIRSDKSSTDLIEEARKTISAVLLCAFRCKPTTTVGLLHPDPVRPFDRVLLPEIEFCRLVEGYETGKLAVEWV